MPLHILLPKINDFYKAVCLHCRFGQLWQRQILLAVQTAAAALFTIGYQTRAMAIVSWFMYTSLILRNTWLYFILDRYFYYLLFGAMFLPLDERWSVVSSAPNSRSRMIVSPATIKSKLLVLWINIDSGVGKYMDPKTGWSYHADPLPALDTYTRHTLPARYLYTIVLGPQGLRDMTQTI